MISTVVTPVIPNQCQVAADVGFVLDSSGSLSSHYQKEKDFVKELASKFGIDTQDSRVGVVTFSTDAVLSIKLDEYSTLSDFQQAVDNIPLMGKLTRIDKGLRVAQNELYALANGARAGLPKILVLLTDGTQTQQQDAEDPNRCC